MGGKGSGNPGQAKTWKVGRKPGYWRGTIGPDARAALSIMALQDAVAERIEQDKAEAALIARLIMEERVRRLSSAS